MNLLELSHLLVRRRRFIAVTTGVCLLVLGLVLILIPNQYTSRASILPTGGRTQLDDLREMIDMRFSTEQEENTSELYPVILRSASITSEVLRKKYRFALEDGYRETTLAEYFDDDDPEYLAQRLGEVFSISVAKRTGVIELSLTTRFAGLSQAVLTEYLTQLEYYNLHRRSSQARQYADYLLRTVETAQMELDSAEDRLCRFQSANRNWNASTDPVLSMELARLERDVTVESATFTFLRKELEMARLDVQKDVPVVRVLDSPTLPVNKSSPRRTLILFLSGIILMCLVVSSVVAWEYFRLGSLDDRRAYESLRTEVEGAFPRSLRFMRRFGHERTRPPVSRDK